MGLINAVAVYSYGRQNISVLNSLVGHQGGEKLFFLIKIIILGLQVLHRPQYYDPGTISSFSDEFIRKLQENSRKT